MDNNAVIRKMQIEKMFSSVEKPIKQWVLKFLKTKDCFDLIPEVEPVILECKNEEYKGKLLIIDIAVVDSDYKSDISKFQDPMVQEIIKFYKFAIQNVYLPVIRSLNDGKSSDDMADISLVYDDAASVWFPVKTSKDIILLHMLKKKIASYLQDIDTHNKNLAAVDNDPAEYSKIHDQLQKLNSEFPKLLSEAQTLEVKVNTDEFKMQNAEMQQPYINSCRLGICTRLVDKATFVPEKSATKTFGRSIHD
jgi:hypothetical protein